MECRCVRVVIWLAVVALCVLVLWGLLRGQFVYVGPGPALRP